MLFRTRAAQRLDSRIITDFNRTLLLVADAEALQASVAARLQELFGPTRLLILELDPRQSSLIPGLCIGLKEEEVRGVEFGRRGSLARWLLVNEMPLIIPENPGVFASLMEEEQQLLKRLRMSVCVPLLVLNRLTGIVLFGSDEVGWKIAGDDVDLLQALAGQAGLAFENAALHREQQDRLRRMYRTERLAAAGQLAAGVAHEIRNPLTSIRSTVQYVMPSFDPGDDRHQLLSELLAEVDRIDRIVNDLLTLSRPGEFTPEAVDMVELLDQCLLLIGAQARKQDVKLACEKEMNCTILADPGQLKQVFLNLLLNALQAMPSGGTATVTCKRRQSELTGTAWMEVLITDTGGGIPAEYLDKIFDPFFTLKKEGTGLGLSISYSIVQQHRGDIEVQSEPGRGTTVVVRLPITGYENSHR
jgi:signal transduction histidine kinase